MRARLAALGLARTPPGLVLTACLALVAGCGGLSADPGLSAAMQVANAQFVAGKLPAGGSGPSVVAMQFSDGRILAGAHDRPLLGSLDPAATAVILALDGDRGYWIVPAGVPATEAPTLPTFDVRVGFSPKLPSGTRTLVAVAVDANGNLGAPTTLSLPVAGVGIPSGALVIHLEWAGVADLDLHVVDPTGVEIWARHPSGYEPPPPPQLPDPTAAANAAQLDVDSNAQCVIDARDQENVVYKTDVPHGHYIVRVDAYSLCGDTLADWRVAALADDNPIGNASGEATDADTRVEHDVGAGLTALEFDVP